MSPVSTARRDPSSLRALPVSRRTLLVVLFSALVIAAVVVPTIRQPSPTDLKLVEIDTAGPGGQIVAITRDHVFRWDGKLIRWASTVHGDPLRSFDTMSMSSVSDFRLNKNMPVAGIHLTRLESFSVSPDGSRVAISGLILGQGPGKGRAHYNVLALDVDAGKAWGLFPSTLKRGARWASNNQVLLPGRSGYELFDLNTYEKSSFSLPNKSWLSVAGSRNEQAVALNINPRPSESDGTVFITEYEGSQPSYSVRLEFDPKEIAFHQPCITAARDVWIVLAKSTKNRNKVVLAIDTETGEWREIGEVSIAHRRNVIATVATIQGKEYLLVVSYGWFESKLFEIVED